MAVENKMIQSVRVSKATDDLKDMISACQDEDSVIE